MIDSTVRIIEALAHLVGALAWPSVAILFFWWFRGTLSGLFSNVSDWSLKAFGVDISAKGYSRDAIITAEKAKLESEHRADDPKALKRLVGNTYRETQWLDALPLKDVAGRTVLWVDDNPENNVFECEALKALGINVDFAPSTLEAIERLHLKEYDVVISDMARPESDRAGFDLLKRLKASRPGVPFVLYSSSNASDQRAAMLSAGAFGATSRASELVRLVVDAIRLSRQPRLPRYSELLKTRYNEPPES